MGGPLAPPPPPAGCTVGEVGAWEEVGGHVPKAGGVKRLDRGPRPCSREGAIKGDDRQRDRHTYTNTIRPLYDDADADDDADDDDDDDVLLIGCTDNFFMTQIVCELFVTGISVTLTRPLELQRFSL